jgi:Tol biopolymer transport system component
MKGEGSNQHRSKLPGYAFWSPDSRRVAYSAYPRKNAVRAYLYVARADGTRRRKVVAVYVGANECSAPEWSPGGGLLVFQDGCDIDATWLYVVRRDGTHRRRIAKGMWTLGPRWSPDGRWILFAGAPLRRRFGLFLTLATGSTPRRIPGLSFDFYYDIDWDWSRDGKRVFALVESNRTSNRGFELLAIGRGGGKPQQLSPPDLNVGAFALSPDGQSIAMRASTGTRDWEIYVMQSDGTGLKQLTDNRAHEGYATWSPDGTKIAFASQRDGNSEIYVMNPDGSNQTNLTRNPADDERPSWMP